MLHNVQDIKGQDLAQNNKNELGNKDDLAQALFEIEAIHFRTDRLFTYSSGKVGPVYIDMRRLLSFPQQRERLMQAAFASLQDILPNIDVIAGGETAGIPFAALLAQKAAMPMIYVRKQAKGFGKMAQIEGHLPEGARVLLVEDLCNYGANSLRFHEALEKAGAAPKDLFVLFDYGLAKTHELLAEKDLTMRSLLSWSDILDSAARHANFDEAVLQSVRDYLKDPDGWRVAHA